MEMDVNPTFKYDALGDIEDALRLVILMPDVGGSNINCRLIPTSFSKNPEYEALSYMWGSTNNKAIIWVDGQRMSVTQNLWSALHHLRSETVERILWIDAICIDQSSFHEKNHQVAQMGRIYSRAEEVTVWLGPQNPKLDVVSLRIVFSWISEVSKNQGDPDPFRLVEAIKDVSQGPKSARRRYCCSLHLSSGEVQGVWRAFVDLCSLDYWHRVWIVQEVVLAQSLKLHLLELRENWLGLATIFDYLSDHFEPGTKPKPISQILASLPMELHRQRSKSVKSRGCSLESLIQSTQRSVCTDPRDKIFALLALAKDCTNKEIHADYSKSVSELYFDVIRFYISQERESTILLFSQLLQRTLSVPILTVQETPYILSTVKVSGTRSSQLLYIGEPWVADPPGEWRGVRHVPRSRFALMMDQVQTKIEKQSEFLHSFGEVRAERLRGEALSRWHSQVRNWEHWREYRESIQGLIAYFAPRKNHKPLKRSEQENPKLKEWQSNFIRAFEGHLITVDSDGTVGLVPKNAQFGDSVVRFEGCDLTIVVRKVWGQYVPIGNCFLAHVAVEESLTRENDKQQRHFPNGKHISLDLEIGSLQLLTKT